MPSATKCVRCGAELSPALTEARITHGTQRLRPLAYGACIGMAATVAMFLLTGWQPRLAAGGAWLGMTVSAGLVIGWVWRARTNLDAFPDAKCVLKPMWAVGAWFVPVANMYLPYQVLAEVTRNSVRSKSVYRLVTVWWLSYLLAWPAFGFADVSSTARFAGVFLLAVAAFSLSTVMIQVSRAQEQQIAVRREELEPAAMA